MGKGCRNPKGLASLNSEEDLTRSVSFYICSHLRPPEVLGQESPGLLVAKVFCHQEFLTESPYLYPELSLWDIDASLVIMHTLLQPEILSSLGLLVK